MKYSLPHMQRRSNRLKLGLLLTGLLSLILIKSTMGAPDSKGLIIAEEHHVKGITELSGLTVDHSAGEFRLLAVGDDKANVAAFPPEGASDLDFTRVIQDKYSVCTDDRFGPCRSHMRSLSSDWEGIAADSRHLFLLQEHSAAIVVLRRDLSSIGLINLDFSKFRNKITPAMVGARDAKLGEGLILLKNGHVAVIKESSPVALIEFGPQGSMPIGVNAESVLVQNSDFDLRHMKNSRVIYTPLKVWNFGNQNKCDASDIAYNHTSKKLFLISQKCRFISEITTAYPSTDSVRTLFHWNIPRKIKNPEALAFAENGDFYVGSDRKSRHKPNLFLLKRR